MQQAAALATQIKTAIDQLGNTTGNLAALLRSMQEAQQTELDRLDTERANKAARKE